MMLLTLASLPLRTTKLARGGTLQACALYDGPETPSLSNLLVSIELEESGLVVEVADSLVANGGRGLFVRLAEGAQQPVTLDKGTPFCGYAQGAMEQKADAAGGKTVAFHLRSVDAAVFFEGELRSVRACLEGYRLETGAVSGIVGHSAIRDDAGELVSIEIDASRQYFVPAAEQPSPTIMTLGQYANDLAVGGDDDERYEERAASANMLVLVQRLERDPETPSVLRPSRPIPTLARTVAISNALPMEVGCEYGERYWG